MSLKMANQEGNSNVVVREYRKGNWTVQETMVLIEAKRMDEERRMKRVDHHQSTINKASPAGGELRWKWVEDYCWRNGCLRSQNQCNDKWDNLMRDFKKVRDYERRIVMSADEGQFSYWKMEKIKRKEHNLPSNLLPEIHEALVNVIEKKAGSGQRFFTSWGTTTSNSNIVITTTVLGHQPINVVQPPIVSLLPHLQHPNSSSIVLPLPPPPQPPLPPPESYPCPQPLTIVDSETSGQSNSSAKRRRKAEETSAAAAAAAATADDRNNAYDDQEIGSAISRSANLIAGAIQANEEREERRHKELLSMHEKRLQIEESKAEINRQGISGMVDAINNLAHSVLALAATNKTPPKP